MTVLKIAVFVPNIRTMIIIVLAFVMVLTSVQLRLTKRALDLRQPSPLKIIRLVAQASNANRWAEGAQMDYYNNTSPLEFISDVYDIMKDGDCLSPEKLNADVVDMLGKYLSAQQSVQRIGLLARLSKRFGAIANR